MTRTPAPWSGALLLFFLLLTVGCTTDAGATPPAAPGPTWPVGIGPPVPEWTPGRVAGRYRAAHQGRDVGPLEVRLIDEATALVTETRPGPDRAVTLRRRHGTWVEDPAVTLG